MAAVVLRTHRKPAGIPVFPPHADPGGDCVLSRVMAEEPWRAELAWPAGFEGGLAHRLDVSTSGAVAVAADPDQLAWLRARFTAKELRKTYLLWAAKEVSWSEHRCDRPLAHDRKHRGRMVVQRGPNTPHRGRWMAASTSFRRVQGRLWRAEIRTGVTHQIRLHAAFVGIPILGDRRYGGGATPPDAPRGTDFFLHHAGFEGPDVTTRPVADPEWITRAAQS
ncbi:MAG: RNA pseudouridine synthase [Myxococcales bacterium]|nr:RNA pseudouridine synthase [Myxococcales bacterium]